MGVGVGVGKVDGRVSHGFGVWRRGQGMDRIG